MKALVSFADLEYSAQERFFIEIQRLGFEVSAVFTGSAYKTRSILPSSNVYSWKVYKDKKGWDEELDYNYYEKIVSGRRAELLPMVDRVSSPGLGSIDAELKLAYFFSVAHDIHKKNKIDIVMFFKEPEHVIEMLVYLIAVDLGVETIFTRFGLFPHARGVSRSWESPLLNSDWSLHPDTISVGKGSASINRLSMSEINKIKKFSDYVPLIQKELMGRVSLKEIIHYIISESIKRKSFRFLLNDKSGPIFKRRLYESYKKYQVSDIPSCSGLVVYFPLHFQPEISTIPRGKQFANQLIAIKMISDLLPEGSLIYVKEHHASFSIKTRGSVNYRSSKYYHDLSRIDKVRLLPVGFSSTAVQDESDVIATVTGTAGLEGMIKGKPVLLFGCSSYMNGPGVFRVLGKSDLENAINTISSGEIRFDLECVEKFISMTDGICNLLDDEIPANQSDRIDVFQKHLADTLLKGACNLVREALN